jgi:hypothetical protein
VACWLGWGGLGGHGDGAGGVECSSGVSTQWGRVLGFCEVEADYRGSMDAPGRRVEGGGVKRWQGLGLPSPLESKL